MIVESKSLASLSGRVVRWLYAFALFSLAPAVVLGGVIDEVEPNDTWEDVSDPYDLPVLEGVGEVLIVNASIGNGPDGAADRDLYRIDIPDDSPPLLLTVTMAGTTEGYDGYLRLFGKFPLSINETPEHLNADDDGESPTPRLQAYLVDQGY